MLEGLGATTASSSAPTPTAPAACARCSPHTAAAAGPTSAPSPAPGTASPAPAAARAARRELRTLTAQLEASLWEEDEIRRDPAHRRRPAAPRGHAPGAAHRARWLGPFRRWDGYRDAVRARARPRQPPARRRAAREPRAHPGPPSQVGLRRRPPVSPSPTCGADLLRSAAVRLASSPVDGHADAR